METMDSKMVMVSALARAGFDDAQISKVLEVAQPRGFRFEAAPAVVREVSNERHVERHVERPLPPQSRAVTPMVSDDGRSNVYRPLVEKIRAHCAANGPTEDTARGFCDRFPEEFKLSRVHLTNAPNARGFSQVIDRSGGVFAGVRFTKLPPEADENGRIAKVLRYRAEVA